MPTRRLLTILVPVLALAALAPASLAAEEGKLLGTYGEWGAQTFKEGGKTGCSIWSKPDKETGKYKRRGEVFVYVTHRPWAKRTHEVSFAIGYTFKPDSEVEVEIGGRKFTLFTDGDSAWNREKKTDRAMVKAMRAGSRMTVKGTSSRDTLTKDIYSLTGFTAAHNAANKACKVK